MYITADSRRMLEIGQYFQAVLKNVYKSRQPGNFAGFSARFHWLFSALTVHAQNIVSYLFHTEELTNRNMLAIQA